MEKQTAKQMIALAARCLLAFVLLRSALAHLANPYAFLGAIYGYELTSPIVGQILAGILPFWSATLALSLLLNFGGRTSLHAACFTFCGFVTAQISVIARGMHVACGCFGVASAAPIGWKTVGLALSGALLAIIGVVFMKPLTQVIPPSDDNEMNS